MSRSKKFRLLWKGAILALTAGAAISACHPSGDDFDFKVVGGTLLSSELPSRQSLVALARPGKDGFEPFCSGTLVATNLVVTAAHCVTGINAITPWIVLFDRAGAAATEPTTRRVVDHQILKEDEARYYPNFDLAWLKLDQPAPEPYQAVEIWQDPSIFLGLEEQQQPALLAGYGKTSSRCPSDQEGCSGIAQEVTSNLTHYLDTSHFQHLLVIGPNSGHGSCLGDSGGPLYTQVAGKWYLIGTLHGKNAVLNSLTPAIEGELCETGESVYLFLGPYVAWIEETSGIALPTSSKPIDEFSTWPIESTPLGENPSLAAMIGLDDTNDSLWYTIQVLLHKFADHPVSKGETLLSVVKNPERAADLMQNWEYLDLSAPQTEQITFNHSTTPAQLENLSPLAYLKKLKRLAIRGQSIRNLDAIRSLSQLEQFEISRNFHAETMEGIDLNLDFLAGFPVLKTLKLNASTSPKILKSVPWDKLKALENLNLSENSIYREDIEGIPWETLQKLRSLTLEASDLEDVSWLRKLPNLREIILNRNHIRDISALAELKNLTHVALKDNRIESFAPLKELKNLEFLETDQNP